MINMNRSPPLPVTPDSNLSPSSIQYYQSVHSHQSGPIISIQILLYPVSAPLYSRSGSGNPARSQCGGNQAANTLNGLAGNSGTRGARTRAPLPLLLRRSLACRLYHTCTYLYRFRTRANGVISLAQYGGGASSSAIVQQDGFTSETKTPSSPACRRRFRRQGIFSSRRQGLPTTTWIFRLTPEPSDDNMDLPFCRRALRRHIGDYRTRYPKYGASPKQAEPSSDRRAMAPHVMDWSNKLPLHSSFFLSFDTSTAS